MLFRHVTKRRAFLNHICDRHAHNFADRFDKFVPDNLKPLWNHPTGPKTIFFWAPVIKSGIVVAALRDITRDPDTISVPQTLSLLISAAFTSRYALVIEPKNYIYFAANTTLTLSQVVQLYRIFTHETKPH